ncbi:MAG: FAD-dependent oxidoreductase, partial [Polyangiaceae bacterium]
MVDTDVAVVGSGPYALSLAAHLRVLGVESRIFGPPMKFWRDMPRGVNLKSLAFATGVYVPGKRPTFPEWCRQNGLEDWEPCTMASFAEYGVAMQRRFVPHLEPVRVANVSAVGPSRFEVTLESEERLTARRVVFATGLAYLENLPEVLRGLSRELVSHTSEHSDYATFRGMDVAVIGAGASSIEAGALVHEGGGQSQILVREVEPVFHGRTDRDRSLIERIRHPWSVLGPGVHGLILERVPLAVHFAPEHRRVRLVTKHFGPASPWWIKDRVEGKVPILVRTSVVEAKAVGGKARLRLVTEGSGERTIEVDHVIAGCGYVSDVDRVTYLDADLRKRLRRVERAPVLSMNFESSVKGAYFVGPIAAMCFGPLFRFVSGAKYAGP